MDPCCECGGCHAISCVAVKDWPHFGPFPLWARGTATWGYGGDSTEFFRLFNGAFSTASAVFTLKGFSPNPGSLLFSKRYLSAVWNTSGISRAGSEEFGWVDSPFNYSYRETYDRYSGQLVSAVGQHAGGVFYNYSLGVNGVRSESGSLNGWMNYPDPGVPQSSPPNFPLLIETQPGAYATVTITENSASWLLFVPGVAYGPSASDITFTNTVSFDGEYSQDDLLSDLQDMLDGFDLNNLGKSYSPMYGQTDSRLLWDRRYGVSWEHGLNNVGFPYSVPRRLFYTHDGFPTPAAAGKVVSYITPMVPSLLGISVWAGDAAIGKAIVLTKAGNAYSFYNEEETPADPGVNETDPGGPADAVYPAQTDCVLIPAAQADDETFLIEPQSISFPLGTLALARACAGESTCTPT